MLSHAEPTEVGGLEGTYKRYYEKAARTGAQFVSKST